MDKLQQDGLKILTNLSVKDRADINKLIEIERKYNLGYNHIVEFCDKKYRTAMYVLTHYCQLKFSVVLQLIKANESKLNNNLTNAQIIALFTGVSDKKADEIVNETDKLDKARNEIFAKKFSKALAAGINVSNGGHAILSGDVENAKKAWLSLTEYLFLDKFNMYFNDNTIDQL